MTDFVGGEHGCGTFAAVQGPSPIVSTEQAGCDTVTAAPSAGATAAATGLDRARSRLVLGVVQRHLGAIRREERDQRRRRGPAAHHRHLRRARVTWRSSLGLRALDASGVRTISPTVGLSTLITWDDRAIAVWTNAAGELQLTRLCP